MILGSTALILSLFLIVIMNIYVNSRSYYNGKDINYVYIPDIIHNNFVPHKFYKTTADKITSISMIICLTVCIITQKWDLLLFFLALIIILHILHLIIVSATTLPDSSKTCKYSKNLYENVVNMGTCNNLGSSGHLMNLGLSLFILSWVQDHKYWYIYLSLYVVGFFTICASRNHYTLDCIVSTLILIIIVTNSKEILKFIKNFCN